jgi:hypothetical protein
MTILVQPPPKAKYQLSIADNERLAVARDAASSLSARLRGRGRPLRNCPIRIEFIRRLDESEPLPPMMRMLGSGGGRGGEVRLKLYLSLLWASPGGDHNTVFNAADWAQLLGLAKYSTNGKRRILEALDWLDEAGFVDKQSQPGKASTVVVLHESGDGTAYSIPSKGAPTGGAPSYRNLQHQWWTNGWLAGLSGRAIAFWLVLLDEVPGGDTARPLWMAESVTTNRYAFSPHMRQAAMRELADFALISRQRKMRSEAFKVKSSRTEISMFVPRLDQLPPIRA